MTFTPTPNYPVYPPYHTGLYLEDYFIDFINKNQIKTERQFIKIGWTSYYNNGCNIPQLQNYLDTLTKNKKYYVVCQHDDAPRERLPEDTLVFSAGGNFKGNGVIPIPLICSPLLNIPNAVSLENKDIFCSFVGSDTHRIRRKLYEKYNSKYFFQQSAWNPTISDEQLNNFIHITSRSKFALCPRGYGASSFRLYETMQIGCVPIYISDEHYLPWSDEINWNSICILIKEHEIDDLDNILKNIDDITYNNMLYNIKQIYNKYFTLEGVCNNILKRLV